jgi:hypothetical protein
MQLLTRLANEGLLEYKTLSTRQSRERIESYR